MVNYFYSSLGKSVGDLKKDTYRHPVMEKLYELNKIVSYLDRTDNEKYEEVRENLETLSSKYGSMPIWGTSQGHIVTNIENGLRKGDIIFFGYKNCIHYIGKVEYIFEDEQLSKKLWNNRAKWKYKVILNTLIQVYMPRNMDVYEKYSTFKCRKTEYIRKQLINGVNFESVLGLKTGNIEGTQRVSSGKNDSESISRNLDMYFF